MRPPPESDAPRLRDVTAAAAYLGGVDGSYLRGLVREGLLCPVRLPSMRRRGESSRRLLFDQRDLDRLIDTWRASSSAAPNAGLSAAAIKGWKHTPERKLKKVGGTTHP